MNDTINKSNSRLLQFSNRSIQLQNDKKSTMKRDIILGSLGVGTALSVYLWYKNRK